MMSSMWGARLPSAGPASAGAQTLGSTGGPGGGRTGTENLTVNLTDAPSFDPRNLVAVAGQDVHFVLNNTGSFNHSFTISAAPGKLLAQNTTPSALNAFLTSNGTLVNVSLPANSTRLLNYTVPGSDAGDSFEFVSQVPYQFQAGMFGFFNVTSGRAGPAVDLNETTLDTLAYVPDVLNASSITSFPAAIDVLIVNDGGDAHTFTLAAQSNVTLDPGSFNSYFSSHPPAVNVVVPGGSGASAWANFTIASPGAYQVHLRGLRPLRQRDVRVAVRRRAGAGGGGRSEHRDRPAGAVGRGRRPPRDRRPPGRGRHLYRAVPAAPPRRRALRARIRSRREAQGENRSSTWAVISSRFG